MNDACPRLWIALPLFFGCAGVLNGFLGYLGSGALYLDAHSLYWILHDSCKALAAGSALALGRKGYASIAWALALGGLNVEAEHGLFQILSADGGRPDRRFEAYLGSGAAVAIMVFACRIYLGLRRPGSRRTWALGLVFPIAALLGYGVLTLTRFPDLSRTPPRMLALWALEEGALIWAALGFALRVGEGKK